MDLSNTPSCCRFGNSSYRHARGSVPASGDVYGQLAMLALILAYSFHNFTYMASPGWIQEMSGFVKKGNP